MRLNSNGSAIPSHNVFHEFHHGQTPRGHSGTHSEDDSQQWATNAIAVNTEQPTSAYVDIKVTEGANTPEEKAEMISQTVKMLQDAVGVIQEACYVVIDDIPANSWGYNGRTQAVRAASKP